MRLLKKLLLIAVVWPGTSGGKGVRRAEALLNTSFSNAADDAAMKAMMQSAAVGREEYVACGNALK